MTAIPTPTARSAYAVIFFVLACACGVCAGAAAGNGNWLGIAPGWMAVAFLSLAAAYAGVGPRVFGKRDTGRQSPVSRVLFAPYFMLNAVVWQVHRAVSREPAFAEVVPNLFFGRRLTNLEARTAAARVGWHAVLDLAPEFAEAPALRTLPGHRSLPVLDATAPDPDLLREAVRWLAVAVAAGPTYVHCALGHGRTGTVVVAYLLATGAAPSVADGVRLLRSHRPGVRLSRTQRDAVATFAGSRVT
ncbi:dual specificity phosphatase : Dual specificity protein phosphatase OS=Chthoniobacter flavus Ellin428 GN=CfE428DRAFT_3717 PE=4 SV=1: DSPc [Gemmataceae bacterium]|nr:dual specificity phosphatase : Dual specificity protein phosphatase OS=Chthoniobacter flavus Ellin428 GN=CfE428DRAFT_3717 PE=4 SV=1: DSPc [Gemmataceae bacterium]VTT99165.1 dual specificity phosphatase : Dual specificity protein phosphatase OS=Chthoniobacter flavus Ellin428 GN=CfE428DRAFT_3717 PE=4 SV=1: DSPc [Gemmataceae bacterium]